MARPSKLFGTLEAPGQKEYPSKDFGYWMNNPDQGVFEIKQSLIRKKLSNGQEWNRYGQEMPRDTMDKFPHYKPGAAWKLSPAAGAYGSTVKATNPETIIGFGILPQYPEEERVKAMLDAKPKVKADVAVAREGFGGLKVLAEPVLKGREKYSEEKIDRLVKLGFSEELIGAAIEEEAKRDIMKVLSNPALVGEARVMEEIQNAYEKYVTRSAARKTGTGASGEGPAGATQSPSVRMYAAAAAAADRNVAQANVGVRLAQLQKVRQEGFRFRHHELEDVRLELESSYSGTRAAGRLAVGAEEAEESGVAGAIGGGPGGVASSGASLLAAIGHAAEPPAAAAAAPSRGRPRGKMTPEAAAAATAKRAQTMAQRLLSEGGGGGLDF